MSSLSFRARIFLALLLVSAVPVLVVAGVGVWLKQSSPIIARPTIIVPVGKSDEVLAKLIASTPQSNEVREAMRVHRDDVNRLLITTQQLPQNDKLRNVGAKAGIAIAAGSLVLLVALIGLSLSRQYAAPLTEIVDWTGKIQRHEPLPATTSGKTMREMITLQQSLYELQQGLEKARATELESERLRAFGEVARRVAHEMKNPLTPIRLAVRQLARRAPADMQVELEVIAAESARLEAMAKDFAELGRLPEGIASPVDLCELLEELLQNAVPEGMHREFSCNEPGVTLNGFYDPLRRVFSNLLRNAVEACKGEGTITVVVQRNQGQIEVSLSDNGPGVPLDKRDLIFQPYFSGKPDGTGLGLAIVRQTVEQHHGSITVGDAAGGGATFFVRFPT